MPEQLLKGKVGVVIGASRNIGRAVAEMLGREGAKVAVHFNSDSARSGAEETATAIKAAGGKAIVFQADLTRIPEVEHLFDSIIKRFGHLDIMVNTAGAFLKKAIADVTEQEYDRVFAINTKAAFFCMQAAANQMSDDGRIVNIRSSLVGLANGYYAAYSGSKSALEEFGKALAFEVADRGITVNMLAHGPVNTAFVLPIEKAGGGDSLKSKDSGPEGKAGDVSDIVPLVRLLVSHEGRFITAQTIFVNGGFVAH
jgi:NAD(P)-dependent dehydrogenase (short-subunit alcohol dehydrogenase family)